MHSHTIVSAPYTEREGARDRDSKLTAIEYKQNRISNLNTIIVRYYFMWSEHLNTAKIIGSGSEISSQSRYN